MMGSGSLCRDKNLKRENVKKWLVGVHLPAAYFYVTVLPLCVSKTGSIYRGKMGNVLVVYGWMFKTVMLLVVWSNQYDNIYLQDLSMTHHNSQITYICVGHVSRHRYLKLN
jgi:uncharacterized PurR-regulated membrane protein YhhQ (DUF165 family)